MNPPEALQAALAGRYRVERELGAGGMATVYLAHDLRHDRDVALKVLRPELAAALGGDRFLSEIRTTAKLQHPHILPLLDSGEAGTLLFYAMPFVAGETLRTRLEREHQLPIEDAIRIAREVADALGAAHLLGIVHRDIKPENILLQGGHALVADFGIALAVESAGGQRMTQTGLSLGTPQYMSPEQAMGERTVDARSDLYSLGAVLYEMLTGDPPFTGSTIQAIVAKVMTEKPVAPSAVRDTVPAGVEHAVLKALAKLPADRWPSAAAFTAGLDAAPPPGPGATSQRPPIARWIHAAITVSAIGAAIWLARRPAASPGDEVVRFSIDPNVGEGFNPLASQPFALSPDGRTIAYVGEGSDRRILLRTLDQLAPRPIAGTGNASAPFFSPDGRWIGYFTNNGSILNAGKLLKVPVAGGTPVVIADDILGFGGVWTKDDRIVLGYQGSRFQASKGGLTSVRAAGGPVEPLITAALGPQDAQHRWPRLLADGETVLFSSWNARASNSRIGVVSVRSGKAKLLDIVGAIPLAVLDGNLLYEQADGTIMAVGFDPAGWTIHGKPVPVLEETSADGQGAVRLAVSPNGTMVYASGVDERRLVLVDERGTATPLLEKPAAYGSPRFSPDGHKIALDITTPAADIWILDRAARTLDRITTTGDNDRPEWTPDGKRVFFRTTRKGQPMLFSQPVDGSGSADSLVAHLDGVHEGSLTPDGRTLVFRTANFGGGRDIWSVELGTGKAPEAVVATKFDELQARLSPDGRWLAYVSDESGALEVYVRSFPGTGARTRVSVDGGTEPVWSPDGNKLFYRSGATMIVAGVTLRPTFTVTNRRGLFESSYVAAVPHANYDVAPGGKELVMVQPSQARARFVVVLNWTAELRVRVAAQRTRP